MKVIILAAGYATRLYPLTLNQPKPLLLVAGKPMVEHVLDNLAPITAIDRIYVVTNAKFADHFQKWSEHYRATKSKFDFTVVNDHSTDDTNKLGAIGDINYVLKTQNVDDDLIVVAGDNLFSDKLGDFGKFEKGTQVLCDPGNPRDTAMQQPTVHAFNAITGAVTWPKSRPSTSSTSPPEGGESSFTSLPAPPRYASTSWPLVSAPGAYLTSVTS